MSMKKQNSTSIIEYLIRYVKTLLALSVNAFSLNPPKKVKQKKLTEYLHEIAYPLTDQDTVEILKRVEEDLSLQNRQEYRSAWHIYLHENEKGEKAEYAEAVLDLCYNLTMEDSIYGISKHYDPKDIESARMVYQCISGNSGFRMIRFRESSVYLQKA